MSRKLVCHVKEIVFEIFTKTGEMHIKTHLRKTFIVKQCNVTIVTKIKGSFK